MNINTVDGFGLSLYLFSLLLPSILGDTFCPFPPFFSRSKIVSIFPTVFDCGQQRDYLKCSPLKHSAKGRPEIMNLYIVGLSNNSLQSREKEKEIRSNVGKIFFFPSFRGAFPIWAEKKRNEFRTPAAPLMFHAVIKCDMSHECIASPPQTSIFSIEYANENILRLLYMILIGFRDASRAMLCDIPMSITHTAANPKEAREQNIYTHIICSPSSFTLCGI